jgi:hypothetical protein
MLRKVFIYIPEAGFVDISMKKNSLNPLATCIHSLFIAFKAAFVIVLHRDNFPFLIPFCSLSILQAI